MASTPTLTQVYRQYVAGRIAYTTRLDERVTKMEKRPNFEYAFEG